MKHTVALKQNHIFRRLYAKGESAVGSFVVIYARRNGTQSSRLGITTGLKLGRAVDRNRARRRIRECYRLQEERLKPGYDIVIVARGPAIDGDFAAMQRSFLKQCKKLKLTVGEEAL
ncbi:MAG: ribonuclease P protein component [Oscillospiraceae bacterium]|nr:ribonuclease P protein component [Oscillospiraceae bacterium]